jgi:hypothetical protein
MSWSDDSTATISGVASATGGYTVTTSSAHGYSNGDYVHITGTTDYNGIYQISNVTSTTFDIVYQAQNKTDDDGNWVEVVYTSSQTGTVGKPFTSAAGLISAVSGTTTVLSNGITEYDYGNYQIDIQGGGFIDVESEMLVSGTGISSFPLFKGTSGKFFLGRPVREDKATQSGWSNPEDYITRTQKGIGLWLKTLSPTSYLKTQAGLQTESTNLD